MNRFRRDGIPTFIHIEKTGGTSLVELLRCSFPLSHCDLLPIEHFGMLANEKDIRLAKWFHPGFKSLAGHCLRPYNDVGAFTSQLDMYVLFRDPVDRYISDFNNDRLQRSYTGSIEDWMQYDDKHDFQTRAIAGRPSLEDAIEILNDRVRLVGTLDDYDSFFQQLVHQFKGKLLGQIVKKNTSENLQSVNKTEQLPVKRSALSSSTLKKIESVNAMDSALIKYVRESLLPVQNMEYSKRECTYRDVSSSMMNFRLKSYLVKRNFIYKPALGYRPLKGTGLLRHTMNSKDYYEKYQSQESGVRET